MKNNQSNTNSLINETSPYLLQHAYNPVNWYPWNEEILRKAQEEDKLLLISIGYSACHWCHVMEYESFEDSSVAEIMNENFICIKVDREERPDVDQIYMTAVQILNQRGGWPLNCIALPDSKPFWGGTYFPKEQWKRKILEISEIYRTKREKVIEFANQVTEGIQKVDTISVNKENPEFKWEEIDNMVNIWSERFDNAEGGAGKSPKFPMPNAYTFLLRYAHLSENKKVEDHVELTLDKMAYGGIYDQIGGGFARYSVDKLWKVPHFEKMLYDNAQLVSLYSEAFLKYKKSLYKNVVFESLAFIEREMMSTVGAFYSALDADSEEEEGKFYVWKEKELISMIKNDFPIFKDYYNINKKGLWEHGNYILIRKKSKENVCKKHGLSLSELELKIKNWKNILMGARSKRVHPGLDDKSLTSWNALMLKGYTDAYMAFGKHHHLDIAVKNANFILEKQINEDGRLFHSYKDGKSTINAYLEDYSLTISAFIRLYEATCNEKWLHYSKKLTKYAIDHFYDNNSGMFFFTSDIDSKLIARKMEIHDNVIPSSNSVMANCLFDLGIILDDNKLKNMSVKMINNIQSYMNKYASGYANYASLILKKIVPYYEIAIVGKNAQQKILSMNQEYHPNKIFIGSSEESDLTLLQNKFIKGSTTIYVCQNKVCQLPINNVKTALKQIKYLLNNN